MYKHQVENREAVHKPKSKYNFLPFNELNRKSFYISLRNQRNGQVISSHASPFKIAKATYFVSFSLISSDITHSENVSFLIQSKIH